MLDDSFTTFSILLKFKGDRADGVSERQDRIVTEGKNTVISKEL
jgi:hypothetical protein